MRRLLRELGYVLRANRKRLNKKQDAARALLQTNAAYEMLTVEAIVECDRAKALKALLINPLIRTADQARGTLDRVWRVVRLGRAGAAGRAAPGRVRVYAGRGLCANAGRGVRSL